MSRSSSPRRLIAGALTAVLAGSLLTAVTATSAQADDGPRTVHVRITKYHNVKMPDVIRPGLHRFVIRSTREAGFQLLRPRAGYTKLEFSRDVRLGFEGDRRAFKRFERNTVLLGGIGSGPGERGVMWARVPRGRVWVFDSYAERFLARKIETVLGRGERFSGTLPGRATLRAIGEAEWGTRPRSIPGEGLIVLRNKSDANHFFGLSKLQDGKTMADFEEWVEGAMDGEETEPPVLFDVGFESGAIGPGKAMSIRYDLPPGRYVMTCWWPDPDMDFMPHVFMGMYRGITVR